MTFIQLFIEKALVGGWQPADRDFRIIGFYERHFEYQLQSVLQGRSSAIQMMVYEAVLLNPKVWQAVGKVEQWYEGHYGPEWLHHMHKMIDALAEGHTLEAYVQSVLANLIPKRPKTISRRPLILVNISPAPADQIVTQRDG